MQVSKNQIVYRFLYTIFSVCVFVLLFVNIYVRADEINDDRKEYECGGLKYLIEVENKSAIVTGSKKASLKTLVIPDKIEYEGTEIIVVGIAEYAFEGSKLTTAKLGANIETIGEGAFAFSGKLKKVSIPKNCKVIGDASFFMCKKLKKVSLSKKSAVEYIGDGVFAGTAITSFYIPNAALSVGEAAFSDCKKLKKITIGSSLERLGIGAFSGCTALNTVVKSKKNLNFEISGNAIYSKEFEELLSAPAVEGIFEVNAETKEIASRAFEDNDKVVSVVAQTGLNKIGEGAFLNCISLDNVVLLEGLETVENNAFSGCTKLNGIEIPKSVTCLEGNPFKYCQNLKDFSVSKENKCYKMVDGMLTTFDGKTIISAPTVYGIVVLNSRIRYINDYAFCGNCLIRAVKLNEKLISVGKGAFLDCDELKVVQLGSGNTEIQDGKELEEILITFKAV